jgi:hypothetical protein
MLGRKSLIGTFCIPMMFSFYVNADQLDKNGILRSDDGHILFRTQTEAMKSCPSGTHLPTLKELVHATMTFGVDVLDLTEAPTGDTNPPLGYILGGGRNPDGTKDYFYYSVIHYQRPTGDLGFYWFWSASVAEFTIWPSLGIDAYDGKIGAEANYTVGAIRCF